MPASPHSPREESRTRFYPPYPRIGRFPLGHSSDEPCRKNDDSVSGASNIKLQHPEDIREHPVRPRDGVLVEGIAVPYERPVKYRPAPSTTFEDRHNSGMDIDRSSSPPKRSRNFRNETPPTDDLRSPALTVGLSGLDRALNDLYQDTRRRSVDSHEILVPPPPPPSPSPSTPQIPFADFSFLNSFPIHQCCPICGVYMISSPQAIRIHYQTYHPDRDTLPFALGKCPECGKLLARRADVARHSRLHETTRDLHSCPFEGCQFETIQKSNLKTHIRTHTGEKNQKCPDCAFATVDPSSLHRHRKRFHGHGSAFKLRRNEERNEIKDEEAGVGEEKEMAVVECDSEVEMFFRSSVDDSKEYPGEMDVDS